MTCVSCGVKGRAIANQCFVCSNPLCRACGHVCPACMEFCPDDFFARLEAEVAQQEKAKAEGKSDDGTRA